MAPTLEFDTFLARYVDTNIVQGSPHFDEAFLVGDLLSSLNKTKGMGNIGISVMVQDPPLLADISLQILC
jgi:hypothetical protein